MTEELLPKELYHWTLNPGHSTGADEWISSPMYPGSEVVLQSGMMLQMDIIPSVPGYGGANAEDGIAIADEKLRGELKKSYPAVWQRIQDRREYMEQELGIRLKEEILPMSDLWYAARIEHMIRTGEIRVLEDSPKKYARVICRS